MKRKVESRTSTRRTSRAISAGLATMGIAATVIGGCAVFSTDDGAALQGGAVPIIRPLPLQAYGAQSAQAYYALGKYRYFQGQLDLAVQAYLRAIEIDPNDAESRNGLGVVYDRMGRFDDAATAYASALARAPRAAHILANFGYSLMLQGRSGDATALLRTALEYEPNNLAARTHLAQAEASLAAGDGTEQAKSAETPQDSEAADAGGSSSPVPFQLVEPQVSVAADQRGARQEVRGIIGSVVPSSEAKVAAEPQLPAFVASVQGAEFRVVESPAPAAGRLRIEISNGNGVTGMARAMRTRLARQGLNIARVTNAKPYKQQNTVVVCATTLQAKVASLVAALPVTATFVSRSVAPRNVDVRVILGADSVSAEGRSVNLQRLTLAKK